MSVQKSARPHLASVERISKLPVVETGYHYATIFYSKIKNSNGVVRWTVGRVEGGLQLAVDSTLPTVSLLQGPISLLDGLLCRGLDVMTSTVPAITYPPELVLNTTKDYLAASLAPVLRRADSVKQISLQGASKYRDLAASRIDSALDVADRYVDKYLPDSTDTVDSKDAEGSRANQAVHAMDHMNRLSSKLKRRLTKRTIAEAQALKRQGADTLQCLLYLADLMIRDPTEFRAKMQAVWANLSEDEPENQVPPATLEQLITMLVRETARRAVHLANFTGRTLARTPVYVQISLAHAQAFLHHILKTVHYEDHKALALHRISSQVDQLRSLILELVAMVMSTVAIQEKEISKKEEENKTEEETEVALIVVAEPEPSTVSEQTDQPPTPTPLRKFLSNGESPSSFYSPNQN